MEQFFTKDISNTGIKLTLSTPQGEKTDDYIMVYGVDSDAYQDYIEIQNLAAASMFGADEDERLRVFKQRKLEARAILIFDWSFSYECSQENKTKFLTNAPQIGEFIDQVTGNRAVFFGLASADSTSTQQGKSSSKKGKKTDKH